MNEEIRKNLTWQRHANIYHLTIESALGEWGQETHIGIPTDFASSIEQHNPA